MKLDSREDMIHKNGNLLDQTVGLPLKRKPLYKELILNNNSVIVNNNVVVNDEHSADSNDDLNNNDFDRDESKYYKCPVCKSEDFTTADFLDEHVKTQHPNFKPSCKDCGEVFPTLKLLASHSVMHVTESSAIRHNPINLKILSFLDTKKSYYHQPNEPVETSQTYRCNFCSEHFVGAQFMTHWQQCKRFTTDESSAKFSKDDSETEEVKSSFLAGLNLHGHSESHASSDTDSNRSLKSEKTDDDLTKSAPSQLMSVIQNTSTYPKHPIFFVPEEEKNFQDDDDDPFKLEVRDMKRRGEFPCRICQKIFRNLRALKGHARIHITCNKGARPYECNICTYSTNDKSMVIRHIRNHNGDHPYKCQLCCSTFTTKANCERHLRNAHRKTSREDIKKLLVDLNNKPQNPVANFKNKLQTLLTTGMVKGDDDDEIRAPKFTPGEFYKMKNDSLDENDKSVASEPPSEAAGDQRSDADESNNSNDSNNNSNTVPKKVDNYQLMPMLKQKYSDFHIAGLLDMRTASKPEKQFYEANYKSYNDVMIGTGLIPTVVRDNGFIKVSSYGNHYHQPESDPEEPLDLSVDVLDLSKKKNNSTEDAAGAEDLSVRARDHDNRASPAHKTLATAQPMFFGKTEMPYNFPSNSIIPSLSPFFVPNTNLNAFPSSKIDSDDDMHSAKIRPLIFNPLIANVEHYDDIRQNVAPFVDPPKDADGKMESSKFKEAAAKPRPSKSSTVKMVMKDGVLVEKQKQRRYRTEKPFSCAYCSGRFTLRSNMDRHVKQQHPGFWRQRQRGGSTRSPRTKSKDESHDAVGVKSESQLSQSESVHDFDMATNEKRSHDSSDIEVDDENEYRMTKKNKRDFDHVDEDDEDEEELVIDEEVKDAETTEEKAEFLSNTSREKTATKEENPDLASVRSLLDNVSTQTFSQYFHNDEDPNMKQDDGSDEDEEGLVAGSSSEGNGSGGEENRPTAEPGAKNSDKNPDGTKKKKSAYSSAPNRVHCDFCYRSFPWASSLRRHTLTHTGQKPYKCSNCPLLFTTKSNCDRHFLRKHRSQLHDMPSTATTAAAANPTPTTDSDRASTSRLIPNFSTRNVPERPFKCSHCPSSTFSTFQNLKKHIVEKHNQSEHKAEDMAYSAEFPKFKKEDTSTTLSETDSPDKSGPEEKPSSIGGAPTYDQNVGGAHTSSDLPFKCHLCDRSFGERQEALDHMGDSHALEFQHLMSKGALDTSVKLEDTMNHDETGFAAANSDENSEQNRGRFPDYSSRKVICAFCLRRFWSAEDLRRHMRTHTGERPFACDICHRRFTLKHSMLRHRKKHSHKSFTSTSGDNSPNTDDEEPSSPYSDNREPKASALPPLAVEKGELLLPPCSDAATGATTTTTTKSNEFETSVEGAKIVEDQEKAAAAAFLPTDKNVTKTCNKTTTKEDGVDLIAKLLDIDDKELVDEMLSSKSADDVAKLLGVQK